MEGDTLWREIPCEISCDRGSVRGRCSGKGDALGKEIEIPGTYLGREMPCGRRHSGREIPLGGSSPEEGNTMGRELGDTRW